MIALLRSVLFIDITFSSPRLNNYSTLPLQGSLHHCSLGLLSETWSRCREHRSWSRAFDGARGYDTQKGGGECRPGQFSPKTNNGFSRGLTHTVNCKLWIRSCTWQKKKKEFFPGDATDYLQVSNAGQIGCFFLLVHYQRKGLWCFAPVLSRVTESIHAHGKNVSLICWQPVDSVPWMPPQRKHVYFHGLHSQR